MDNLCKPIKIGNEYVCEVCGWGIGKGIEVPFNRICHSSLPTKDSIGFGDTIAKFTHATKLDKLAEKIAKILGYGSCGCKERQNKLNKLFPYKKLLQDNFISLDRIVFDISRFLKILPDNIDAFINISNNDIFVNVLSRITNIPIIDSIDEKYNNIFGIAESDMDVINNVVKNTAILYCNKKNKKQYTYIYSLYQDCYFEWNFMNMEEAQNFGCVIDNILLVENGMDNSVKYKPAYRLPFVITSRGIKNKQFIEDWLISNDIQYDKLYMKPNNVNYLQFKIDVINKSKISAFVEGVPSHAKEIHDKTGVKVICPLISEIFN